MQRNMQATRYMCAANNKFRLLYVQRLHSAQAANSAVLLQSASPLLVRVASFRSWWAILTITMGFEADSMTTTTTRSERQTTTATGITT